MLILDLSEGIDIKSGHGMGAAKQCEPMRGGYEAILLYSYTRTSGETLLDKLTVCGKEQGVKEQKCLE